MDSNTPFPVILKQAAALKSEQLAQHRRRFDSWSPWYQSSFYADGEITRARIELSFKERMNLAVDLKDSGNKYFKMNEYMDAKHEYERALSLFKWVYSKDPNWKSKGIADEDLIEDSFQASDEPDIEAIKSFQLSCLLNLAIVYGRLSQWKHSILACDECIRMDPLNAKAFYRRAQARSLPPSCGITENEMALDDLRVAYDLLPTDALIRNAYFDLQKTLQKYRIKSKTIFKQAFHKTSINQIGDKSEQDQRGGVDVQRNEEEVILTAEETVLTIEQANEQIRLLERTADQFQSRGDTESAKHFINNAKVIREEVVRNQAIVVAGKRNSIWDILESSDFMNPTEDMIEEAKANDVDLTDAKTREMMMDLHNELINSPDERLSILVSKIKHRRTPAKQRAELIGTVLNEAMDRVRRKSNRAVAVMVVESFPKEVHRSMLIYRRGPDLFPRSKWNVTNKSNSNASSSGVRIQTDAEEVNADESLNGDHSHDRIGYHHTDISSSNINNSNYNNNNEEYDEEEEDEEFSEQSLVDRATVILKMPDKEITEMLIESISDDLTNSETNEEEEARTKQEIEAETENGVVCDLIIKKYVNDAIQDEISKLEEREKYMKKRGWWNLMPTMLLVLLIVTIIISSEDLFGDVPGLNNVLSKIYPGWKNSTKGSVKHQKQQREMMGSTNRQQRRQVHEDLTGEF